MTRSEYFDTPEFKEILSKYEDSMLQGKTCYMESEEFVDVADYYLTRVDNAPETLRCVDLGLKQYPGDEVLLSIKSATYIFKHQYADALDIVDTLDDSLSDVYYQKAQLEYAYFLNTEKADEMFRTWIEREEKDSEYDTEREREDRLRDAYLHVVTSYIELCPEEGYDAEIVKLWIEDYILRFKTLGDYDPDLMLADIIREEGMVDMVVRLYTLILETNPYVNNGWTVLSAAQLSLGNIDEALEAANFAIDIAPNEPSPKIAKAHCLYSLNRIEEAYPLIQEYLEATDDASQYVLMALVLNRMERYAEAIEYADKACVFFDTNYKDDEVFGELYDQSNFEVAEAYCLAGDCLKAYDRVNMALANWPDNSEYLLLKGSVEIGLGQYEDSINTFGHLIDVNEDKVGTMILVATRYFMADQYMVALKLIEMAERNPAPSPARRLISGHKAAIYYQLKDYNNLLESLKVAVEECPDLLGELFYGIFPDTVNPKDYYKYVSPSQP